MTVFIWRTSDSPRWVSDRVISCLAMEGCGISPLGAKTKTRRGWGTQHWYNIKRSETYPDRRQHSDRVDSCPLAYTDRELRVFRFYSLRLLVAEGLDGVKVSGLPCGIDAEQQPNSA